ncbi:MAG: OmpA family protein [Parvularculaceae bacterium]|nr:OmpA family protein [Parvularculaceae bacterium]
MTSLLDTVLSHITPSIASAAASQLGESDSAVGKAVKAIAASIFAGLIGKSNDAAAFGGLFSALADSKNAGFLNNIGGLIGGGNLAHNDPKDISGKLIGAIFGDKTANFLNAVSQFGNLKPGSASALLGLAGPVVMGVLGKKIAADNLNADGLKQLLNLESDSIRAASPPGVAEMFGLAKIADMGRAAATATAATGAVASAAQAKTGSPSWLWAIPAVLGLGVVGWLLTRGDPAKTSDAAAPAPAIAESAAAPVESAPAAETPIIASIEPVATEFIRDLGGFQLKGAPDGVEAKLIAFIESGKAPCTDAECWFTFDRLTFNAGSAELDPVKSQEQLNNIAQILKAFPGIQLKIGGYTDNTGSQAANLALSQARAEAVVAAIAALGIDPSRLSAEGYGPQFPVADNATEEGRAQNRRIDVRVRARS